jgi:hypothetical protein
VSTRDLYVNGKGGRSGETYEFGNVDRYFDLG